MKNLGLWLPIYILFFVLFYDVILEIPVAQVSFGKVESEKRDELLREASVFIEKGEFAKAIPLLEEANHLKPDPKVVSDLISAYENEGERLAKQGLMNEAVAVLDKSKKLSETQESKAAKPPEAFPSRIKREVTNIKKYFLADKTDSAATVVQEGRSRVLFEQAFQSYREKQYGLARGLLQDGIKENNQNPIAYELLGDIEYFTQNLDEANEAYKKSYRLDANERVKGKLEKLLREEKVEKKLSEYLDEHFIIRYDREEDLEGFDVREYLRETYRTISKDFGHYPAFKTVVILCNKQAYQSVQQIPLWSGALFDGKIRIPIYERTINRQKLRRLIQHELTHVFVSDLSKNRAPVWFQEGLAQYEENKIIPIDLAKFRNAIRQNNPLTVAQIKNGIKQGDDESKVLLFYQQVYALTSHLITQYHFYRVKELLKKLSEDLSLDNAFLQIYSISFSEFCVNWMKEISSGELQI